MGGELILDTKAIVNEEFKDARIATPVVIALENRKMKYTIEGVLVRSYL